MQLNFTKMQGCGNDYIYLDCRAAGVPAEIESLCRALCPRHLAVGADGIICICAPDTADGHAAMRMYNADGSEGSMCGNGVRCVAQWLHTHVPELAGISPLRIDTRAGQKILYYLGQDRWTVNMGRFSTLPEDVPAQGLGKGPLVSVQLPVQSRHWPVTCVSMGNPHCVTVVPEVDSLPLAHLGPLFEKHPAFPKQVNAEFIQVLDATHLKMRVWERGSGETWACGTGACAAAAALTEQGVCPKAADIQIELLGGTLTIRVMEDRTVWLTGPAKEVYAGTAEI